MKLAVETITPMMAEAFLSQSGGNRSIKEAKVRSYGRDMASGDWMLNGEPIIFDATGTLVDGHHRLKACARTGVSFESVIVRGAANGSQKTIDMGSSRTLSDVLSFNGEVNCNALVATINSAVSIANGAPRSANLSSAEVLRFIELHPCCRDYAGDTVRLSLPRVGSLISGIGVAAHETGFVTDFSDFSAVLKTGIPAYDGCPVHALRDRILRDAAQRKKMPLADAHRLVVAAWGKFINADSVSRLSPARDFSMAGWTLTKCFGARGE